MWAVLILLSMPAYAAYDIIGKKIIEGTDKYAPLRLRILITSFNFLVCILLAASGLGESGLFPWQIAYRQPMILLAVVFTALAELFYLVSLRFIGLSVQEALSGVSGAALFLGLFVVELCGGTVGGLHEILQPIRLIPILIIFLFTVLLPNVELLAGRKAAGTDAVRVRSEKRKTVIGIAFVLLAIFCDAGEAVITVFLFDGGQVGVVDYMMTGYFFSAVPLLVFVGILHRKGGRAFLPQKKHRLFCILYCILSLLSMLFYLMASEADAVKSGILFCIYPVIAVLGARLVLKEKYTWRQYLCIWMITAAAVVFCLADFI